MEVDVQSMLSIAQPIFSLNSYHRASARISPFVASLSGSTPQFFCNFLCTGNVQPRGIAFQGIVCHFLAARLSGVKIRWSQVAQETILMHKLPAVRSVASTVQNSALLESYLVEKIGMNKIYFGYMGWESFLTD